MPSRSPLAKAHGTRASDRATAERRRARVGRRTRGFRPLDCAAAAAGSRHQSVSVAARRGHPPQGDDDARRPGTVRHAPARVARVRPRARQRPTDRRAAVPCAPVEVGGAAARRDPPRAERAEGGRRGGSAEDQTSVPRAVVRGGGGGGGEAAAVRAAVARADVAPRARTGARRRRRGREAVGAERAARRPNGRRAAAAANRCRSRRARRGRRRR